MTRIVQVNGHGLFAPAINERSVVLDLGANLGKFSSEIIGQFGCRVIMVEANPDLSRLLQKNGTDVYTIAVGGSDGVATFNVSSNVEASSLLALPDESAYGATLDRRIEVKLVSLASLLKSTGPVDVLKMDIEGAEVAALGSVDDDALRNIGQITVEFHDDPSFHFDLGDSVSSVIARLERLGFTYLQFNRPSRTNALFLGPALGLSRIDAWILKVRYDFLPSLFYGIGRAGPVKWISRRRKG
jgi:FkbM family methyltransferase